MQPTDQQAPQVAHPEEEKEIDLLALAGKLWQARKTIGWWLLGGIVVGLIIAFSIPREYTATVKLAPETNDGKSSGSLGALAAMAGIGGGSSGADAVYPQLYPDVMESVPFVVGLFDVPVPDKDAQITSVRSFLETRTSQPWWGVIMGLPGKAIGAIRGGDDDDKGKKTLDSFRLTVKEDGTVRALRGRVNVSVDTKTQVVNISVTMQDPVVAAVLADTVALRLQKFVTDYRTNKARSDLEYAMKLNEEAKDAYYKAQQRYADYQDRNQGIVLQSVRTTGERLQNEMSLAFSLYNQTAQQLQQAQAKVQANTPVFAVLDPATVPLTPSAPRKAMILIGFAFLSVVAASAWVLFGRDLVAKWRAVKDKE